MSKTLGLAFLISLACIVPFVPGLSGPFILDDVANLDGARAPPGTLLQLVDAAVGNESGVLRRPVSNLSFALTAHFVGVTAFDYKAVNLFIHLLNGLLVWALTTRILRLLAPELTSSATRVLAAFAAAAWMLHPLQVSTVLYAVQRMSQLSALFLFSALYVAIGFLNKLRANQRARHLFISISAVTGLVALSILSKENGALFPLMLLVILFCSPKTTRSTLAENAPSRFFIATTVFAPLALAICVTILFFKELTSAYSMREFTLAERLFTQPFVIGHYLYSIFIPDITNMGLYLDDFPTRTAYQLVAWYAVAVTIVSVAIAAALRTRAPLFSFGVLWFVCAHALESTFIPLEMAFEHRNHVALLGPIIAVTFYLHRILNRLNAREQLGIAIVPIIFLFGQTLQRSHQWSRDEFFIKNEIVNHPNSLRALSHAASYAANNGNIQTAADYIQRAQALAPEVFWYHAVSINLTCAGASTPVDWDHLAQLAQRKPNQLGIDSIMEFIVDLIVNKRCDKVAPAQIDRLLIALLLATESLQKKEVAERLNILRYRLSLHSGADKATAENFLNNAIDVNPTGIEALELYAYASLKSNRIQKAAELTDTLERRINTSLRATLLYKVNDLRIAIGAARQLNL